MTIKLKIGISILLGFLVGTGVYLSLNRNFEPNIAPMGADIQTTDEIIAEIRKGIETDLQPNGKYKQKNKTVYKGIEYEVHEYETAKGEIGYTLFITKEENDKIYKRTIATGVEKSNREQNWILVQDNTFKIATTTNEKTN